MGSGKADDSGNIVKPTTSSGSSVLYQRYSGSEFEVGAFERCRACISCSSILLQISKVQRKRFVYAETTPLDVCLHSLERHFLGWAHLHCLLHEDKLPVNHLYCTIAVHALQELATSCAAQALLACRLERGFQANCQDSFRTKVLSCLSCMAGG